MCGLFVRESELELGSENEGVRTSEKEDVEFDGVRASESFGLVGACG